MKKRGIALVAAVLLLTVFAGAVELPDEVKRSLPEGTEKILRQVDLSEESALHEGISAALERAGDRARDVVRRRLRGAAAVMSVVLLCGVVGSMAGGEQTDFVLGAAGAVSVTLITAGSLEELIGLGSETIRQLSRFSTVLLPALAAASAASGQTSGALAQRAATVMAADVLLKLIHELLMPMVYLYIGMLTASAALREKRLEPLVCGIKKCITWALTSLMMLFTLYLSAVRVVSGTTDALGLRLTKTVLSGVVPVVGGIIAEASETVLSGAMMLRSALGVGGMIAIVGAVAYPFLQLGVQYLVYKLTAALSAVAGPPELSGLINGLGDAFGLVLGMTGACALLLFISVLSFLGAVVV